MSSEINQLFGSPRGMREPEICRIAIRGKYVKWNERNDMLRSSNVYLELRFRRHRAVLFFNLDAMEIRENLGQKWMWEAARMLFTDVELSKMVGDDHSSSMRLVLVGKTAGPQPHRSYSQTTLPRISDQHPLMIPISLVSVWTRVVGTERRLFLDHILSPCGHLRTSRPSLQRRKFCGLKKRYHRWNCSSLISNSKWRPYRNPSPNERPGSLLSECYRTMYYLKSLLGLAWTTGRHRLPSKVSLDGGVTLLWAVLEHGSSYPYSNAIKQVSLTLSRCLSNAVRM